MTAARKVHGWELRESGPTDADHTLMLLPGAMCNAVFYDDLLREPALNGASIRFVTTTLPGFCGTPPLDDLSIENTAGLAGKLASEFGCDAVVGHSVGANLALEMVAAGQFGGPVALLEPAFSRKDEFKELSVLDRIGPVPGLGHLAWVATMKTMGKSMKGEFPPDRHDALVAEMKKNDPGFCRRQVRAYFAYLDRHGSLVQRLCGSGARALVVFGDRSDIGLADEERRGLEACPDVTMVSLADAAHFVMIDQPARTAELILELLSVDAGVSA